MSLISDEVIDYEQWLWDREVGMINRLDLFQVNERVASKCPFSVCPVEIEVGDCEFVDGGGI